MFRFSDYLGLPWHWLFYLVEQLAESRSDIPGPTAANKPADNIILSFKGSRRRASSLEFQPSFQSADGKQRLLDDVDRYFLDLRFRGVTSSFSDCSDDYGLSSAGASPPTAAHGKFAASHCGSIVYFLKLPVTVIPEVVGVIICSKFHLFVPVVSQIRSVQRRSQLLWQRRSSRLKKSRFPSLIYQRLHPA